MRFVTAFFVAILLVQTITADAATIFFSTNPLTGSAAETTPGRQIVGGEPSIAFNIATDVFAFDPVAFGVSEIQFANSLTSALPTTDVNFIVVQDTGSPFLAGIAANLIAARLTEPGPGFFIYFNTELQLARLVYSADLTDTTADLAVLARITNLSGAGGFAALPTFTAENVELAAVPEPATVWLLGSGIATLAAKRAGRARRGRPQH